MSQEVKLLMLYSLNTKRFYKTNETKINILLGKDWDFVYYKTLKKKRRKYHKNH